MQQTMQQSDASLQKNITCILCHWVWKNPWTTEINVFFFFLINFMKGVPICFAFVFMLSAFQNNA